MLVTRRGYVLHRFTCAAITRGCGSVLTIEGSAYSNPFRLDLTQAGDQHMARMLSSNGWHLDYGRWVCSAHPAAEQAAQATSADAPDSGSFR